MTAEPENSTSRLLDNVPVALVWRYLSHSIMLGFGMWAEMRAAPSLPDTVLGWIPRSEFVLRHNYTFWLIAYVPLALWLWRVDRRRFVHFLYVGGLLSLIRGVCITLTGLGPVFGDDVNASMSWSQASEAWWALVNPVSALWGDAPQVYLTKDLYFSGHTSSTFLLLLYLWRSRARWLALFAHVAVVITVFWSHLHYTIDVVGAWTMTACVYVLCERYWPSIRLRAHRSQTHSI
ncbi:MAG: phosphatase PAP2-related protein [Myxococcota bacterium]|nr:phosphatase PAP2-related protein [Myxococcota bacterium]